MICFHFTIFVVLGTTEDNAYICAICCDLLSFYYLCRTRNNSGRYGRCRTYVVICFHFTIFVVLGTTHLRQQPQENQVVICFHFTIFVVLGTTMDATSDLPL